MLPRAERLTRAGLFQRMHSLRKVVSTPLLSLYVLERQSKSAPRPPLVGFVVGKKAHLKATRRNRVKRRLREAYRVFRQEVLLSSEAEKYNIEQWYALAWHVKAEAVEASFGELRQNLLQCLEMAAQRYGHRIKSKSG